jgi:ribosomal protein L30/L7E
MKTAANLMLGLHNEMRKTVEEKTKSYIENIQKVQPANLD